jgi:hypothetical protein
VPNVPSLWARAGDPLSSVASTNNSDERGPLMNTSRASF